MGRHINKAAPLRGALGLRQREEIYEWYLSRLRAGIHKKHEDIPNSKQMAVKMGVTESNLSTMLDRIKDDKASQAYLRGELPTHEIILEQKHGKSSRKTENV